MSNLQNTDSKWVASKIFIPLGLRVGAGLNAKGCLGFRPCSLGFFFLFQLYRVEHNYYAMFIRFVLMGLDGLGA
jgi:hypothetical protein